MSGEREKPIHDRLRDHIAEAYRQKGYLVFTEKSIGNRRVDIYAENDQEVLIVEVVDTHDSDPLSGKDLHQIKTVIVDSKYKTSRMVFEGTGTFKLSHKGKTGILYIPADLVKDSSFPLKEGKVEVRIEGDSVVCSKGSP